jgi:hypothetical protein
MKLDINEREYRLLLDVVHLGNWVVNSCRVANERIAEFDDLQGKVFAFAEAFGFQELVDYDSRTRRFAESREFEDDLDSRGYVSQYEEETFWRELASRLADKYLLELYGEESLRGLSRDELFLKRMAMEEQVWEVLEREGIGALTLSGFAPDKGTL